ncbi:MAG: hypothetical protein GY853_02385 [PVC group bacterium]|nr:hypothetical protein [PVC group bacterium]
MPFTNGEDFKHRISRGINNFSVKHVKAKSIAPNATMTTMWAGTTTIQYLSSVSTLRVSSSEAGDDQTNTAAQRVYIEGLNEGRYSTTSEEIWLRGTTPVTTTNNYSRINKFKVTECGSTGHNTGTIYLWPDSSTHSSGVPTSTAQIQAQIAPKEVEAWNGTFTLGVNQYGYLQNVWFSGSGGKANCRVLFMNRTSITEAFIPLREINDANAAQIDSEIQEQCVGRSDYQIRLQASSAGSYPVAAGMDIIVVEADDN